MIKLVIGFTKQKRYFREDGKKMFYRPINVEIESFEDVIKSVNSYEPGVLYFKVDFKEYYSLKTDTCAEIKKYIESKFKRLELLLATFKIESEIADDIKKYIGGNSAEKILTYHYSVDFKNSNCAVRYALVSAMLDYPNTEIVSLEVNFTKS